MKWKYCFVILVPALLVTFNTTAAVNTLWDNTSGDQDWHNPLNWQFDDTVPSGTPGADNSTCWIWPDFSFFGTHPIVSNPNAVCDMLFLGAGAGSPDSNSVNLELTAGASLTVREMYLRPNAADFANPGGYSAALYIEPNSTLNVTSWFNSSNWSGTGQDGDTVVDMNGGTFNIYNLAYAATTKKNQINLHGGTINIINSMALNAGCNMDITTGTLILAGDQRSAIELWKGDGRMTAYGGSGTLFYDYNVRNAGKTTVTTTPPFDCPDTTPTWQRNTVNLLSGFLNMYNPHVIYDDADASYPYKMWFFGWSVNQCNSSYPGCDAIFAARSADLTTWQVYKGSGAWDATMNKNLWVPVLTADNKYYDQWHNGDPSVVKRNGIYYMAYSATGFDSDGKASGASGDIDGDISCVMGATSTDGINWTRSAAPLLIYAPEIGQMENTTTPSPYTGMFHRPSLMWDNGQWRMWFDYWQPNLGGLGMGHATCSGDPMVASNWTVTHTMANALIKNFPNPDVVKLGGVYYAYGDPVGYPGGSGWTSRQLSEAVSVDGINWDVRGFISPDSDTPANQVPEAAVLTVGGREWLYLFYACQVGGSPYNANYDRIRAMRISKTPRADLNGDDKVDLLDFAIFADEWLAENCSACNLDFMGQIDIDDFHIFIDNWFYGK